MKVKSKVRMGAAAWLLLCAFLSLCSRGVAFPTWGLRWREVARGQLERLAEPPGLRRTRQPQSQSSPRQTHGSWEPGGFPWLPSAHLLRGFNLTSAFTWATSMGGRQHPWFLPSSHHRHYPYYSFKMMPLSHHSCFVFFFKESFSGSQDTKWSRASLSAGNFDIDTVHS